MMLACLAISFFFIGCFADEPVDSLRLSASNAHIQLEFEQLEAGEWRENSGFFSDVYS